MAKKKKAAFDPVGEFPFGANAPRKKAGTKKAKGGKSGRKRTSSWSDYVGGK